MASKTTGVGGSFTSFTGADATTEPRTAAIRPTILSLLRFQTSNLQAPIIERNTRTYNIFGRDPLSNLSSFRFMLIFYHKRRSEGNFLQLRPEILQIDYAAQFVLQCNYNLTSLCI